MMNNNVVYNWSHLTGGLFFELAFFPLMPTSNNTSISDTDLGHRLVLQRRLGWGLHASLHLVLVREEGEHGLLEREAGVADTRRHEWLRRHQCWLGREHGRQHLDTVNGHGHLSCLLSWSLTPNIGRRRRHECGVRGWHYHGVVWLTRQGWRVGSRRRNTELLRLVWNGWALRRWLKSYSKLSQNLEKKKKLFQKKSLCWSRIFRQINWEQQRSVKMSMKNIIRRCLTSCMMLQML